MKHEFKNSLIICKALVESAAALSYPTDVGHGDLVVLRSGSPVMRVVDLLASSVTVAYRELDDTVVELNFVPQVLVRCRDL